MLGDFFLQQVTGVQFPSAPSRKEVNVSELEERIEDLEIRVEDIEDVLNTEELIEYIAYVIREPRNTIKLNSYMINLLVAVIDWLGEHEEVRERLKEILNK